MRKESAFNWVVLAAVTRQVGHPDRHPDRLAQLLEVILEQISIRGIASAAITQKQDTGGIAVALLADAVPIPTQTVGGKLAGVMAQSQVDVTDVAPDVVDAMRNQLPISPTWKIMVQGLQRRGAIQPALAIQAAQKLLGFGVNGEGGVAIVLVLIGQFADAFKLLLAIR